MDHYANDTELIVKYVKELKLPTVKDSLEDIIADADAEKWNYRKFLRVLLQREIEQRIENRKYVRIRKANFAQMKYSSGRIVLWTDATVYLSSKLLTSSEKAETS